MPFKEQRFRITRQAFARMDTRAPRARDLTGFLLAGGCVVSDALIGLVLWRVNVAYVGTRPASLLVIHPPVAIWFLVYLIAAFCISLLLYDLWIRPRFGPHLRAISVNYTLSSPPLPAPVRMIAIAVLFISGVLAVGHVRKHVRFTGDAIVEQSALELGEEVHAYAGITRLEMARFFETGSRGSSGRPSRDRHLFAFFSDGSRWSLKDAALPGSSEVEESINDILTRHTNVRVEFSDEVIDRPAFSPAAQRARLTVAGLLTLALSIVVILIARASARRVAR